MTDGKIPVRYARALFESALERKLTDKVYDDMKLVSDVCLLPDFKEFLESPVIVPSKKAVIIHEILGKRVEEISLALIDLTVKNGRESYLPSIARVFIQLTKKHLGITASTFTTPVKIDDRIKQRVIDLVSGIFKTKVELREVIDKDIIGGFILRVEDHYLDASVRSRLKRIEKELRGSTLTR
jgi:F-type H+-transporting ATPase subunit delta